MYFEVLMYFLCLSEKKQFKDNFCCKNLMIKLCNCSRCLAFQYFKIYIPRKEKDIKKRGLCISQIFDLSRRRFSLKMNYQLVLCIINERRYFSVYLINLFKCISRRLGTFLLTKEEENIFLKKKNRKDSLSYKKE